MKQKLLFFSFLVCFSFANAQLITVTGTVVDDQGIPIPGASVVVQNTTIGVITDFDGQFSIQAPPDGTLVVSYLGFQTKERRINNETVIKIILDTDLSELDEVILTGYSEQKKERVTGAAEAVDVDVLTAAPRAALQESFQGNVAGVQVTSATGQPGAIPDVRIRGVGSFAGSSPLYVVDGMPVDSAVMVSLNPNDIQAVSVLKDAAATSIYGARGANGVIVIQTRSGIAGQTIVRYSGQQGWSSSAVADRFKPLSTPEFQELMVEGVMNADLALTEDEALEYMIDNGFDPNVNTDWYDLNTRTGLFSQHNIDMSGGNEDTRFFVSGGYFKQEGVILATDLERMNTRVKLDHDFDERLSIGVNLSYNKTIQNVRPSGGAHTGPVRAIYRIQPFISPYDDEGNYAYDFNNNHNPLALAEDETRRNVTHRILAGANANYRFTDYLSYESSINMNTSFEDFFVRLPAAHGGASPVGSGGQDNNTLFSWTFRNLLRFDQTFGESRFLTAFAGYELTKYRNKYSGLGATNILDGFEDLVNASIPVEAMTYKSIYGLNSVFANAEYSFEDKYLISGSLRRDGSARFSENKRYGLFWSVGLGWNIAKERFLADAYFLNDLKLRGSYGVNGNDAIGNNRFITYFSANAYNGQVGRFFEHLGNSNIQWEENKTLDIGVDFALFNRRISGSFDWYHRETTNLLRFSPISATNGNISIPANIGSMENKGIEISLTTRNMVSNNDGFEWRSDVNFTSNKNEITKLENNNEPIIGTADIIAVGEDINTFYLPLYAGVDPSNGNALWYTDGSGTETTTNYSEADPAIVGKSTPDFYGSLRNTLSYKNFTLGFQFYMSWGGLVYDYWARYTQHDGSRRLSNNAALSRGTYERRWQNPGDITDIPRIVYGNTQTGGGSMHSSRFIYDGSYVRLREAELAYDFEPDFIGRMNLSQLRVYVKGNNLWTYIKDDRLERDPEASLSGRLDQNIPISSTVFVGLNVSF
jgi:TonB-linked SusC/RagA family outer membrane protein